jgi:hypothetical protein
MAQESNSPAAPYLPLKTFLAALDALREGVPKRIDRGIWRSKSGSIQGQIMIALRFFDLVNDTDEPAMPLLEKLAKADEPERKKILKSLVETHYKPIIAADLTKMTPSMLNEAMAKFGVSGGTVRKSVTFFLQLAKHLDLAMSPFLSDQTRNSPAKRRTRAAKAAANGNGAAAQAASPPTATGSMTSVTLKGGGTVTMSVTADVWKMPADDRKFVLDLVDRIQEYGKVSAAAKPREKAVGQS